MTADIPTPPYRKVAAVADRLRDALVDWIWDNAEASHDPPDEDFLDDYRGLADLLERHQANLHSRMHNAFLDFIDALGKET